MKTQKLVSTALLLALGLLLPTLFHMAGLGKPFLPMHLPALLAGFLLGPASGVCVGVLTPLLSSLLTGAPPLIPPIAPLMMAELGCYGLVGGFLYQKRHVNVYCSLLLAIAAGRLIYGLLGAIGASLLPALGFPPIPVFYLFTAGLVEAIPGVILQLFIVPLAVAAVERNISALWRWRRA